MDFVNILKVLAIAASPISELRGAIPIAIGIYSFPWYYAYIFGIIGNLLPVPFILLFLKAVSRLLSHLRFFDWIMAWFFAKAKERSKIVARYQRIGLALFVAIPFPFTGAWTGSVVAVLLGLRFRFALLAIVAGVLIAGAIVTAATILGLTIFGILEPPA